MLKELVIVTGLGTMGLACARRLGNGRQLLLVDNDQTRLDQASNLLQEDGFAVDCQRLDLGDPQSIHMLLTSVEQRQMPLRFLLHTAAVSPTMASASRIYQVNLEGTARLLDAMLPCMAPGAVGIVIASMGAQFVQVPAEVELQLAVGPVDGLTTTAMAWDQSGDANRAYLVAKRGNQVRVEAQSLRWAKRSVRLISISPGVISTAQGRQEIREQPEVARLVQENPMQRIGTPDDIANAVEWLTGPAASYITGADLRIDGGTIAALRWHEAVGVVDSSNQNS
ncbi:Glucose 1-dehydrogenase 2 [Pseudomonas fluorescens]|uniref:SDR family oxidoreductase n=1 Tax=Pseudomonas fluorescens TaxID=294 RepID=UPI001241FDB5|nr:SDR family oxidoreductase [Pseudomonas fluorescens]VVN68113.1 Glucose 1-dehydrogenase 2 [Pseudomonas fluorescens]